MKTQKLLVIAASVCLLAFFLAGAAQAQDLGEIIVDYCEDVAHDATEAIDELSEARADLEECSYEFFQCLDGLGPPDPVDCAGEVAVCQKRGLRDEIQACNEFLQEFKRNTKRAETRAKIKDVKEEFVAWFFSAESDDCLAATRAIVTECQTIIEAE